MFVIDKYLSPVVCSIMPLNNELNKGFILISIKFIKIIKQVIIPKTFKGFILWLLFFIPFFSENAKKVLVK